MYNQFNLEYLKQMRSNNMTNSEISYNISKKTKYSTGFGVLKKALNLAISLNYDNELLSILHRFIGDKQKLSTNYSTIDNDNNKDHTNTNQNSDNSDDPIQRQALAPLDENIQFNKNIFKETIVNPP
ncbi:hypothetical protein C2G38_2200095 [Gigaspora rosea]|uniref:Uncharacterized protein n=1 Tax=Gigaspora rosea TaxID=44941 RepID=A0A397UV94_9GLOM|nr:hypothetical protein C2G38_2200095 [Gigaspora rosea]